MDDDISIVTLDACPVVARRAILLSDEEIRSGAKALYDAIPEHERRGPPMAVYHWETIVPEGQDVEVCVPVREGYELEGCVARTLRHGHGFFLHARCGPEGYGDHYRMILSLMVEKGVHPRSQRELYYDLEDRASPDAGAGLIIVMHPWVELLERGLDAAVGTEARIRIMEGRGDITPLASLEGRATWIRDVIGRIEQEAGTASGRYAALSGCADFFPQERIDAYRRIYEQRQDVDDVIDFMRSEQYWYKAPYREGRTVYVTKNPRNRAAFEAADTPAERHRNYCHCTMLRNALDKGISPTFCYCGAGWFRQQWEGLLGTQVEIRVVSSVLNGDDACTFAIHLPPETVREE